MNRKTLSAILGIVLVGGVVAGVGISHAATPTNPKPTAVAQTATPLAKVKISRDEASKIALKAHQGGKITDVQRVKRLYTVHLQTPKGNVTMKIGANTGRILSDVLENRTSTASKIPVVGNKNVKDTKDNEPKTSTVNSSNAGNTQTKTFPTPNTK